MNVPVEVSAHHIHLSLADCVVLFGKAELTLRNNLSQKGEFASEQVVEIVGPKNRIHKVRVLGPLREKTQLEISRSESYSLGIDAPLALSGAGLGADIKIVGPKGELIAAVAMVAKRHYHVSETVANKLKLKNSDTISVKIPGERSCTFDNVVVRVSSKFSSSIHIDTDEANAAGVGGMAKGEIIIA